MGISPTHFVFRHLHLNYFLSPPHLTSQTSLSSPPFLTAVGDDDDDDDDAS
jgi:hypothetical protein